MNQLHSPKAQQQVIALHQLLGSYLALLAK